RLGERLFVPSLTHAPPRSFLVPDPSPPPNPRDTPAPRVAGPHAETLEAKERPAETDVPTEALPAFVAAPLTLVGRTFGAFELLEEIGRGGMGVVFKRSEEHTSELQSLTNLVCRLL